MTRRCAAAVVLACSLSLLALSCAPAGEPAAANPSPAPPAVSDAWPPHLRACAQKARETFGVPTLSASEAAALPADVLIVDVREPREVAVSALPHAMPLTSEASRAEFLRKAAGETVLVYCTEGGRSAAYTDKLAKAGVKAFCLDGGLCAWAAAGQPVVGPDGKPTQRIFVNTQDLADCVPSGFVVVTE